MKRFLWILLTLTFTQSYSQIGNYFIKNYAPIEYQSSNQVWGIVQDNQGIMYFAADKILEYDGVSWRKIPLPNKSTVRSLALDSTSNTIFVGGVNEFGYLKADKTGKLVYQSLSSQLDSTNSQFYDVWRTEVGSDGVYFSTNSTLFRYSFEDIQAGKDPITIWKNSNSFFLLYKVNNRIFTGVRGEGIVEVIGDSLIPLKYNKKKEHISTWFMFPYQNQQFLIGNSGTGISVYNPNSKTDKYITKSPLQSSKLTKTDQFLADNQLYSGAYLGNGKYALGTITGGIIIINKNGEIIHRINKKSGLQNQTIHYLYKDKQGGLWAAMTYGISRIEINTPITNFNDLSGIEGSIYNTIRTNGDIYVSSNLGLFKKEKNHFYPVEGLTGPKAVQCFGLENINVPYDTKPHLFAYTTRGVYEIIDKKAKAILDIVSFDIVQANSGTLLMADENIIYKVRYENNKWNLYDKIVFKENISNLFLENDSVLWFIQNKQANKVLVDQDFNLKTEVQEYNSPELDLSVSSISRLNNKLLFITNKGLYKLKGESLYKDTLLYGGVLKNENQIVQIKQVNKQQVWINCLNERTYKIKILSLEDNQYQIDSLSFNRLPIYEDFVSDGDSIMWILSAKAMYRANIKNFQLKKQDLTSLNRMVEVNSDSVIFMGSSYRSSNTTFSNTLDNETTDIPNLAFTENNLRFEFALASYNNEKENEFSYCLQRNNAKEQWSKWSVSTKKEYTNLFEGEYKFKVKARNIYNIESKASVYLFSISPPWYRTYWAYIFYLLFLIIVIWVILKIYTLKLKKEKILLEKIVKNRTQEIWDKKEEISLQADNLKKVNESLLLKNQEINQQNAEIEAQRDNLQALTEDLQHRAEEIATQKEDIEKQKDELENINHDVHDSIKYAHRLQNAALPKIDDLKENIDDAFIFFKPKDIVSGDFYWFANVEDNTVVTAADCTGHGVPGALMSILGISLIKEVVVREYMTHPGVILRKLRKGVISALNQSSNSIEKDGMDMSLISINNKEKTVQYAGAFNSLYLIRPIENTTEEYEFMIETSRNEKFVFYEIKADKMPISIYVKMDRFNTHEFNYKSGDMLFLYSDGFADQFGGPKGKKYKYKPFKQLLLDNAEKSMSEQKESIYSTFKSWKGELEQVDDIVIIGLKL